VVLRLYGKEFEALSDGVTTTITMGSVRAEQLDKTALSLSRPFNAST
jgi:hypothetical protein